MSAAICLQLHIHTWTSAQATAFKYLHTRTQASAVLLRNRPRRIEDRPSASAAVRARRPKAAHTMAMFDTDAMFHVLMSALKAFAS